MLNKHQQFITFDGMRFVAAVLIVTRHVPFFGSLPFAESYLAVDLFFCLSGFVIANAYEQKLLTGMGLATFVRVRVVRLYPLYLLGITLGVYAQLVAGSPETPTWLGVDIVLSLFAIPHWLHGSMFPLDVPVWSLFFEVFINIVYVVLLRWLVGIRLLALIAASAVMLAVFVALYTGPNPTRSSLDYGWTFKSMPIGLARIVFSFYMGILIQRHRARAGSPPPVRNNLLSWVLVACVAAILTYQPPGPLAPVFEIAVEFCLFPCLVIAGSRIQPTGISASILRLGGLASYAIYVLHAPLSALAVAGLESRQVSLDVTAAPWAGVGFLVGLTLLCLALDAFYDAPARRMLSRNYAVEKVPV